MISSFPASCSHGYGNIRRHYEQNLMPTMAPPCALCRAVEFRRRSLFKDPPGFLLDSHNVTGRSFVGRSSCATGHNITPSANPAALRGIHPAPSTARLMSPRWTIEVIIAIFTGRIAETFTRPSFLQAFRPSDTRMPTSVTIMPCPVPAMSTRRPTPTPTRDAAPGTHDNRILRQSAAETGF